jgi:hypothetical protein
MQRLPLEPLTQREPNRTRLAATLGVRRGTINKWQHAGLNPYTADAAAAALGCHPTELWGDQWLKS